MKEHEKRVWDEKKELDKKLEALESFTNTSVFEGLSLDEQVRLQKQKWIMTMYSSTLAERIENF